MPTDQAVSQFYQKSKIFQKVLAGQINTQQFFSNPEFKQSKDELMLIYKNVISPRYKGTLFTDEAIAAAWIAKIRHNEEMSDALFIQYLNRSEEIFNSPKENSLQLDLKADTPEKNDLCAIMWGIEALNGIQSFNTGATRVRLPKGKAPQIIQALEDAGSKPRESTHATGTKLVDKGLGKDLNEEFLRKYTPRGVGAILVIPTSQDGKGPIATATKRGITDHIKQKKDYDLLLKREDYGYNDTTIHNRVHSKIGFLNYLDEQKQKYAEGLSLVNKKSALAQEAEKIHGQGKPIHRKEHLSELKKQASSLITLLEEGKKQGLFKEFTTKWVIRIKWPPFEKKIVSSNPSDRKGLGMFLKQMAEAERNQPLFAENNKKKLNEVRGLIDQAIKESYGPFQQCREGNEVLVDCSQGKANLVENISKNTENEPVIRETLDKTIVSEIDPEKNITTFQKIKNNIPRDNNKTTPTSTMT